MKKNLVYFLLRFLPVPGVRHEWGDGELVKPLPAINSSSSTGQTRAAESLKMDQKYKTIFLLQISNKKHWHFLRTPLRLKKEISCTGSVSDLFESPGEGCRRQRGDNWVIAGSSILYYHPASHTPYIGRHPWFSYQDFDDIFSVLYLCPPISQNLYIGRHPWF